jgi:hypothetical protein
MAQNDVREVLRAAAGETAAGPDVAAAERRGTTLRRRRVTGIAAASGAALVLVAAVAVGAVERGSDSAPVRTQPEPTTTTVPPPPGTMVTPASIGGTLLDGRPFEVRNDPPHGLCVRLGDVELGCDDEGPVIAPDADPATPRTAIEDEGQFDLRQAGVLRYGFLPAGATRVVLRWFDGRETSAGLVVHPAQRIWAIPIRPGDNPEDDVSYRTDDGREVPYQSALR